LARLIRRNRLSRGSSGAVPDGVIAYLKERLASALCAGLMIRPLRKEFPSSLEVSRTCMHKRFVTTHVCNAKVPTQNPFLVDPSQREHFCAPHH
jgi:hypothetical protein